MFQSVALTFFERHDVTFIVKFSDLSLNSEFWLVRPQRTRTFLKWVLADYNKHIHQRVMSGRQSLMRRFHIVAFQDPRTLRPT